MPPAPRDPQRDAAQARTAQKLVNVSHVLGYGGLGAMFVLAPAVGIGLHNGTIALALGGLGFLCALGGAIVGQVGRGMQGRVL